MPKGPSTAVSARLPVALALAALVLLAGCLGSGGRDRAPGGDGDGGSSTTGAAACGAADDRGAALAPPGLAQEADGDVTADGQRTLRWDLVVEGACQAADATATAELRLAAAPPQGCPAISWHGAVTSGLSETAIDVAAGSGSATVRPSRTDLGAGPATVVVSLAATFTAGFAAQDEQCLDGTVESLALALDYRVASA